MKSKNKNLVYLALIFALILAFCGALLLSVFVVEKVAFAEEVTSSDISSTNFIGNPFFVNSDFSVDTVYNNSSSGSSVGGWRPLSYSSSLDAQHSLTSRSQDDNSYALFSNLPTTGNRYFIYPLLLTLTPDQIYSFAVRFRCSSSTQCRIAVYGSNSTSFSTQLTGTLSTAYGNDNWQTLVSTFTFSGTSYSYIAPAIGCSANGTVEFDVACFVVGNFVEFPLLSDYYLKGYSSAVNSISNFQFTIQNDMFENLSDTSSIYTFIEGSYYTFSKITSISSSTAIAEVGLNVGWKDIFVGLDWNTLSLSNVGFSWRLGTVSKSTNSLAYSSFNFVSSEPRFLPTNVLQLGASDPNSSRSYIQIDLDEHSGTITVPCFLSSYTSSDSVPNLYPLYQLTPLTFTMDSNLASSFLDGYNNGYRVATSTVIDTSASWSAGYNTGVSSAQNTTFDSLMSAVIDVPIRTIGGLLDFNFLGINLLQFIYSLLTLGIIIAIIRLCLGKS